MSSDFLLCLTPYLPGALLIQELAIMNQGKLQIDSSPDKGTIVDIYLPKSI